MKDDDEIFGVRSLDEPAKPGSLYPAGYTLPPNDDDDATCSRCNGEGRIMHGDGYAMCPNCKGEGEV